MSQAGDRGGSRPDFHKEYHVIAKLGEGGMAVVHLAVVRSVAGVRKLAVLKSVRPELFTDPRIREMFLAEARLAVTLNHPNIVQTYEAVVMGGQPVLVMEYLEGQSLSRVLRREPRVEVPLSLRLFVLKDLLGGLDYLHSATDLDGSPLHLVHRDVSPQNVFVTYDGHVKLLDFGIATKMGAIGTTEVGVIKGKVRYMSPEQLVGSDRLDRRADLFAVGVMLWEAITGQRMWEGVPDVQVIQSLAHGNVPAPSSVAANVPPLLEAICKKALAVRCGERYESAAAMQADLERAIVGLAVETDARQVGKLVAAWFGEPRAATKKAIEAQLKDQNASVVSFAPEDRDAPAAAANSISGERSRSERAEPSGALQAEARRRRLRSRWIAAATFTSLAIAAALVSRRDGHPGIAPSVHAGPGPIRDAPPSPSASSTAAPVKDQVVHVFFQATPPAAKLYWDDAPLPGNPFEGDLPSDSARHTIRAELGGYASQTHVAALSGPLRLTLKLEGTPEHHRAAPGSGAGHAVGVATTTTVPAPRSGNAAVASAPPRDRSSSPPCTPPFFFDSAGIKHVKPECLD